MISATSTDFPIPKAFYNGLRLVNSTKPDVVRYWEMRANIMQRFYGAMFADPYRYVPEENIIRRVKEKFNAEVNEDKAQLYYLEKSGLLERRGDFLRITNRGVNLIECPENFLEEHPFAVVLVSVKVRKEKDQ